MDQNLNIGECAKQVPAALQVRSKFLKIENLAITNERQRPVFIEDRLIACGEIDDAQPAEAEPGEAVLKNAVRVWAAVADHIGHRSENPRILWLLAAQIKVA
jgi:hypothetical protein